MINLIQFNWNDEASTYKVNNLTSARCDIVYYIV